MLEITMSDTEKLLLQRSNLFNSEDIISFCLLLSYGKLNNLSNTVLRKNGQVEIDVKNKLKLLEKVIKKYKEIRIWYSSNDNENMCNVCYLTNYLSTYNIKIYLCDVIDEGRFALGCYSEKEIEGLLLRTKLLTKDEIEKYIELWDKLEEQNSDIRIIEDNTINSYDFVYLDEKILDLLSDSGSIRYWGLIAKCTMDRIYNFSSDSIFKARIDYLIKNNFIKVDKIIKEEDYFGKEQIIKYISINKNTKF